MSKVIFVTATGTEIGKTYFMQEAIKYLLKNNQKVAAIKPIISGIDASNYRDSDSALILAALGLEIKQENLKAISPWQYETAAAPNIAAKSEGKEQVNFQKLVDFCQEFIKKNQDKDVILIEGAGGLMVPINDNYLIADLIKQLDCEVIICTGNYLGTISHSLTTLHSAKIYNKNKTSIFLNNYPETDKETFQNNQRSIESFSKQKTYTKISEIFNQKI